MQDLSAYQSDPADADPGPTAPAAAQQRTKTMLRSKSEGYSKGEATRDSAGYHTTSSRYNGVLASVIRCVCRNGSLFVF